MAQPYVGEIRLFAGNFAPAGWMFCEGQLLPISENETLFQLIGTTYGGDGESTFALPDLRGRAIVGVDAIAARRRVLAGKIPVAGIVRTSFMKRFNGLEDHINWNFKSRRRDELRDFF